MSKEMNSPPVKKTELYLYRSLGWNEWNTVDPFEFLELIKEKPDKPVRLRDAPENWIRREHIDRLVSLLHSTVPVSATAYFASAHAPPEGYHSTVGHEAARMIDCYRRGGRYPPSVSDLDLTDAQEIEKWWREKKTE